MSSHNATVALSVPACGIHLLWICGTANAGILIVAQESIVHQAGCKFGSQINPFKVQL